MRCDTHGLTLREFREHCSGGTDDIEERTFARAEDGSLVMEVRCRSTSSVDWYRWKALPGDLPHS